ncbi:hypothetical protein GCM10010372_39410 [Streptomyces tauricus]|nr:hypothetical protein GCM10010372_39410 [Streptomyces tauricus]
MPVVALWVAASGSGPAAEGLQGRGKLRAQPRRTRTCEAVAAEGPQGRGELRTQPRRTRTRQAVAAERGFRGAGNCASSCRGPGPGEAGAPRAVPSAGELG